MAKKFSDKKISFYMYTVLFFVLVIMFTTACNIKPQKPQKEEGKNKPPEIPTVLEEMEADILRLMYDIDTIVGIEIVLKEKEKEESASLQQKAEVEIETQGKLEPQVNLQQSKEQEDNIEEKLKRSIEENYKISPLLKEEGIESTIVKISQPPSEIDEVWHKIGASVEFLYKKWNILEADLDDVSGPKEEMEKFEEILDKVYEEIMNKDPLNSLLALNNLTNYLADFRNSFTSKVPYGVFKMKYHIRQSVLYSYEEKYQEAQQHINKTKELKNNLQQQLLEKDAKHIVEKFDLSIEDLEKQIINQNFNLIKVNGVVVIKNIELMKDTFKGSIE